MILGALWFFLPAALANAAPVAASLPGFLKKYNTPLDLGKTWRGQRLFGDHKTWRGLIAGVVIATLTIAIQKYLFNSTNWAPNISWLDYNSVNIWLLGPLFGLGALLGDATESFLKRQFKIDSGQSWFPFDQTDYIIGGCLFSLPVIQLPATNYFWIFVVWFVGHLTSVYVFYKLGVRKRPI